MAIERAFGRWKERWGVFHLPICLSLRMLGVVVQCTMKLHNMCIDDGIAESGPVFSGTRREMSDVWLGDGIEAIFNDMTHVELRNLVDVPHAHREWLRHHQLNKGIMAHDPCTACNLLCSNLLLTTLLPHLHLHVAWHVHRVFVYISTVTSGLVKIT
jgi:hypothetical protein